MWFCHHWESSGASSETSPENVRQIVQSVDHLLNVCVLITHNGIDLSHSHRVRAALAAAVAVARAVHVIASGEWITIISAAAVDQLQTVEQLHDGVDPIVLQLQ